MVELILLIGLFYPKIGLVVGFLTNSLLPNSVPFIGDVLLAIFLPRLLFIIYIVMNLDGLPNAEIWLILHSMGALVSLSHGRLLTKIL